MNAPLPPPPPPLHIGSSPGQQNLPATRLLSQPIKPREPVLLSGAVHMPLNHQREFRDIRRRSATMRLPQKSMGVPSFTQLKHAAPHACASPPPVLRSSGSRSETTPRDIIEMPSQDFRQLPRKESACKPLVLPHPSAPIPIPPVTPASISSTQSSPSSSFLSQSPTGSSVDGRLKLFTGPQSLNFASASKTSRSPSPSSQKGANFNEAKLKLEGSLNLLAKPAEGNVGKAKTSDVSKQEKAKQKALKEEEKRKKKQEEKERKEKEKEEKCNSRSI